MRGFFLFIALVTGCSSGGPSLTGIEESEYEFSAPQMHAALLGTWSGTWSAPDAEATTLTLELRRPRTAALTPLCSERHFAGEEPERNLSCIPQTSMTLEGSLSVADGSHDALALTGEFEVLGRVLSSGNLRLSDEQGLTLSADWKDGEFTDCEWHSGGGPGGGYTILASCTLDHRQ